MPNSYSVVISHGSSLPETGPLNFFKAVKEEIKKNFLSLLFLTNNMPKGHILLWLLNTTRASIDAA